MLFCAFSKEDLTLIPCVSELAVSSIREGVELSPLTKKLSIQWVGLREAGPGGSQKMSLISQVALKFLLTLVGGNSDNTRV